MCGTNSLTHAVTLNLHMWAVSAIAFNDIAGVINRGGQNPCEVPELTESEYRLEAPTLEGLKQLRSGFENALLAAAKSTGCTTEARFSASWVGFLPSNVLAAVFRAYLKKGFSGKNIFA